MIVVPHKGFLKIPWNNVIVSTTMYISNMLCKFCSIQIAYVLNLGHIVRQVLLQIYMDYREIILYHYKLVVIDMVIICWNNTSIYGVF